jgi:hypothetical protein
MQICNGIPFVTIPVDTPSNPTCGISGGWGEGAIDRAHQWSEGTIRVDAVGVSSALLILIVRKSFLRGLV